jgi:hypothetical protein
VETRPPEPVAKAPSQPRRAPPSNQLSQAQIAALTQQFRQTIAQSQADATNVRPPKTRASTMKHYNYVMSGRMADLTTAQGYVTVLKTWTDRVARLNWYYVEVRMVYDDGSSELVDIPWPVAFPIGNDPIAVDRVFHHIPDPPPNYVLPHPFQLSRLLCLYYRDECKAVIDAEERNGGQPAAPAAPAPGGG